MLGEYRQVLLSNSRVTTKKTKKVFIPNCASFVSTILARGHVYSQTGCGGILCCGSRFLPTNSGVKTKKKTKQSSLRGSHVFFVVERGCTHSWKAQAVVWRSTGPEMHYSATGTVTLFWGTILARGDTIVAWEAQALIWGSTAPKCSHAAPGLATGLQTDFLWFSSRLFRSDLRLGRSPCLELVSRLGHIVYAK